MNTLKKLERIAADMEQRPELVRKARADGFTWEQIAEALAMSRAGVIKLSQRA